MTVPWTVRGTNIEIQLNIEKVIRISHNLIARNNKRPASGKEIAMLFENQIYRVETISQNGVLVLRITLFSPEELDRQQIEQIVQEISDLLRDRQYDWNL